MAGAISERGIPAVVDVVAEPGFDPHPPPGMVNRQRRSTTGGLNPFGKSGFNLGHVGMASRTRLGVCNRMNVYEHMCIWSEVALAVVAALLAAFDMPKAFTTPM